MFLTEFDDTVHGERAIVRLRKGFRVKFVVFHHKPSNEYHVGLFPEEYIHNQIAHREFIRHVDYEFVGAGTVSKHADPMWGSQSCIADFGHDRPADETVAQELLCEIAGEVNKIKGLE